LGRFGNVMIVSETTLSVALLSAAVVLAWGFARYAERGVDLPHGEILTAQVYIAPPADGPTFDQRRTESHDALLQAVATLPGVNAFGSASSLPRLSPRAEPIEFESANGEALLASATIPQVRIRPGFLAVLGGQAVTGRLFSASDLDAQAPPVAIVNQPFVDAVLAGQNPIGRRFRVLPANDDDPRPEWREIVGVVPDLGILVGDADRTAGYYVPMRYESLFYLALQTRSNPQELAAPLRRAVFELDPDIVLSRVQPLEAVGQEDRTALLAMSSVLSAIGMAALGLSLVGMYAVMSLAVTRRTREIGIRVALGATRRQILQSILGRSGALLAIGAVLGSLLALGLTTVMDRVLVSQLPNPGAWVLPVVALFLALSGFLASWAPAHRALGINPTEALGHD
jgi:putative ABC transport system permease protein